MSILYTSQIDISSYSREIKYLNIGRTHTYTQTDRQTHRVKTIPRNTFRGGEVIMSALRILSYYSLLALYECVEDFLCFCRNCMVTRLMRARITGVVLIYLQFLYLCQNISPQPIEPTCACMTVA